MKSNGSQPGRNEDVEPSDGAPASDQLHRVHRRLRALADRDSGDEAAIAVAMENVAAARYAMTAEPWLLDL